MLKADSCGSRPDYIETLLCDYNAPAKVNLLYPNYFFAGIVQTS